MTIWDNVTYVRSLQLMSGIMRFSNKMGPSKQVWILPLRRVSRTMSENSISQSWIEVDNNDSCSVWLGNSCIP